MPAISIHSERTRLTWIDEGPKGRLGRKQSQSKLRAHAARVAHQRRRIRQVAVYALKQSSPSPAQPTTTIVASSGHDSPFGRIVLPKPTAWHGNSDPFDSQALRVSPRAAQTIDFLRHAWIQRTHFNATVDCLPSNARKIFHQRTFDSYMSTLSNETFGKAFLLPYAVMLQQLVQSRELELEVSELRLEVLQMLKSGFKARPAGDKSTMYLTQSLLLSSIAERNVQEVYMHGSALHATLTSKREPGNCPLEAPEAPGSLSDRRIGNEAMTGVLLVQTFAPKFLSLFTLPCSGVLSTTSNASRAWEDGPMRRFGMDIRHCLWMWYVATLTCPELLQCRQFAGVIWLGIHDYLGSIEGLLNLDVFSLHASLESRAHWYTQACMAVGLLCHLRTVVAGRAARRDSCTRLTARLRTYLPKAADLTARLGEGYRRKHRDVFLFALWCGSVLEQDNTHETDDGFCQQAGGAGPWCRQELISTAKAREIADWEALRVVLAEFAPYIPFPASGCDWIDEALDAFDQ